MTQIFFLETRITCFKNLASVACLVFGNWSMKQEQDGDMIIENILFSLRDDISGTKSRIRINRKAS